METNLNYMTLFIYFLFIYFIILKSLSTITKNIANIMFIYIMMFIYKEEEYDKKYNSFESNGILDVTFLLFFLYFQAFFKLQKVAYL